MTSPLNFCKFFQSEEEEEEAKLGVHLSSLAMDGEEYKQKWKKYSLDTQACLF